MIRKLFFLLVTCFTIRVQQALKIVNCNEPHVYKENESIGFECKTDKIFKSCTIESNKNDSCQFNGGGNTQIGHNKFVPIKDDKMCPDDDFFKRLSPQHLPATNGKTCRILLWDVNKKGSLNSYYN